MRLFHFCEIKYIMIDMFQMPKKEMHYIPQLSSRFIWYSTGHFIHIIQGCFTRNGNFTWLITMCMGKGIAWNHYELWYIENQNKGQKKRVYISWRYADFANWLLSIPLQLERCLTIHEYNWYVGPNICTCLRVYLWGSCMSTPLVLVNLHISFKILISVWTSTL